MNIYLYGNCQTTALMNMIREDHPDWTAASFDVSQWPNASDQVINAHLERARQADLVIAQPVGAYQGRPGLSTDALRTVMRDGAAMITMPSIVFEGTHGAFTYLPDRLGGFRMDYHNSHTIEMFIRGYHWDDVCLLQGSPGFYSKAFVDGGIEASLTELRHREEMNQTTVKVAPLIDAYCRSMVVMNTMNHPNRFLLSHVLNQIYQAMAERPVAKDQGVDYLPDPFIPPLPTVLAQLGFPDDRPHYSVNGSSLTRTGYLRESLAYYGRLRRDSLVRAFSTARGVGFLAAYHNGRGALAVPSLDLALHRRPLEEGALVSAAFGALFKREPGALEREKHVAAIHHLGLDQWFAILLDAEEFTLRYSAVSAPPAPVSPRE